MTSSSGFHTQEDSVVHQWAMFRLIRRVVKAPRGEVFERTYVSTPGAVATVAVTDLGEVVLVFQYRAEPHGPEEDMMTTERVSFSRALQMVDSGEITDAKTAYGLLLAARRHPHLVR